MALKTAYITDGKNSKNRNTKYFQELLLSVDEDDSFVFAFWIFSRDSILWSCHTHILRQFLDTTPHAIRRMPCPIARSAGARNFCQTKSRGPSRAGRLSGAQSYRLLAEAR